MENSQIPEEKDAYDADNGLEQASDIDPKEAKMLSEAEEAEEKKVLESAALVLFSTTADENSKLEAIYNLSDMEFEVGQRWENEMKLLASVYDKEPSSKVRMAILDEFEANSVVSILAIDKIVYAAQFDKSASVKKHAIKILKESMEDGSIDYVLGNPENSPLKNRYKLLVKEIKELGIK